jgi:cell wall-associated NlpC family hydrolase
VAKANKLSNEVDALGQQYDGLKIQLAQARSEVKAARATYLRDEKLLRSGQVALARIAVQGYMNGSLDPSLQLLQTEDAQRMLDKASIMAQLQQENGSKLTAVTEAQLAAARAKATADQQESLATKLAAQIKGKVAVINAKVRVLNGAAYKKALLQFDQTGTYPTQVLGNDLGARALKWAMGQIGKPYQWGAAGPGAFDCSGLVMAAYNTVGINLAHLTFDQWNEGVHVPYSELKPGDLVFFFNLNHVGLFVRPGLFLDAPTQGQDVQIQPMLMDSFNGGVHIPG